MPRMNINILGISEPKWMGVGKFNSNGEWGFRWILSSFFLFGWVISKMTPNGLHLVLTPGQFFSRCNRVTLCDQKTAAEWMVQHIVLRLQKFAVSILGSLFFVLSSFAFEGSLVMSSAMERPTVASCQQSCVWLWKQILQPQSSPQPPP